MKKLLLFLCASIFAITCGAAPKHVLGTGTATTNKSPLTAPAGSACSLLDAATINGITGLHITKVKDNGDTCLYVDPTAPVNGFAQTLAGLLGAVFGGGRAGLALSCASRRTPVI